jgi:hypothetical protein
MVIVILYLKCKQELKGRPHTFEDAGFEREFGKPR